MTTETIDPLGLILARARFDWQAYAVKNDHNGADIHVADGQKVRVVPSDWDEWDAGVEVYAFNRNGVLMRSLVYSGPFDLDRTMAMVDLIAPKL